MLFFKLPGEDYTIVWGRLVQMLDVSIYSRNSDCLEWIPQGGKTVAHGIPWPASQIWQMEEAICEQRWSSSTASGLHDCIMVLN